LRHAAPVEGLRVFEGAERKLGLAGGVFHFGEGGAEIGWGEGVEIEAGVADDFGERRGAGGEDGLPLCARYFRQ